MRNENPRYIWDYFFAHISNLSPHQAMTMMREATTRKEEAMSQRKTKNHHHQAAQTTSCISSLCSGNFCLLVFHQLVSIGIIKCMYHVDLTIACVLHLFADMFGGYLCFVISILCIGIVTAIIGDVASHFGCTLGIKDSVTAIVFVALGTSIPGMLEFLFHNRFGNLLI